MLEIKLIETANAGQKNTILEFPHVAAGLKHHSGICGDIILER
jgi:hypothetical protein